MRHALNVEHRALVLQLLQQHLGEVEHRRQLYTAASGVRHPAVERAVADGEKARQAIAAVESLEVAP